MTKQDTNTRHTQHPFSMYRCLRKKVPNGTRCREPLQPFPPLFNVGSVKTGVVCRLRKKIPFLRGRRCTAISTTLKRGGRGRRTRKQHGVQREPFFADTGINKNMPLGCLGRCSIVRLIHHYPSASNPSRGIRHKQVIRHEVFRTSRPVLCKSNTLQNLINPLIRIDP